jgi:hypothetical protein
MTGPKWIYEQPALETNNRGAVIIRAGHGFYGFDQFTLETNAGVPVMVKHLVRWPGETNQLQVNLAMQADGFAPQTATVELLDATNVANFTLSPGNIFRGRVMDEAGNPIAHAVVQTDFDFKNQIVKRFDWTTHTDGNGRFEWDSAPAAEICYWFAADGYTWIRGMPLPADGSDHEITLKRNELK